MTDYKAVLLQLIASLTLDENGGDIAESVNEALEKIGVDLKAYGWFFDDATDDLRAGLHRMGVTTLWGTEISPND